MLEMWVLFLIFFSKDLLCWLFNVRGGGGWREGWGEGRRSSGHATAMSKLLSGFHINHKYPPANCFHFILTRFVFQIGRAVEVVSEGG